MGKIDWLSLIVVSFTIGNFVVELIFLCLYFFFFFRF